MSASLRRWLRKSVPAPLRLHLALALRRLRDNASGAAQEMAGCGQAGPGAGATPERVNVTQPIRRSEHFEGKLANLALAAQRLHLVSVPPGKLLSFWKLVGEPSQANGFALGRAIRADAVAADIGGGLCQISGLAYELGLRAGLEIVERHPHSQDLYTEQTRFTPLGLDATVVWGHKDLRLRNGGAEPVVFGFAVTTGEISGQVWGGTTADIRIERRDDAASGERHVAVWRGSERVSQDVYRLARG